MSIKLVNSKAGYKGFIKIVKLEDVITGRELVDEKLSIVFIGQKSEHFSGRSSLDGVNFLKNGREKNNSDLTVIDSITRDHCNVCIIYSCKEEKPMRALLKALEIIDYEIQDVSSNNSPSQKRSITIGHRNIDINSEDEFKNIENGRFLGYENNKYIKANELFGSPRVINKCNIHLYPVEDTIDSEGNINGFSDSLLCEAIIYDIENKIYYELGKIDSLILNSRCISSIFKAGSTMYTFELPTKIFYTVTTILVQPVEE